MPSDSRPQSIRFPPDLHAQITAEAERLDRSFSWIVTHRLRRTFATPDPPSVAMTPVYCARCDFIVPLEREPHRGVEAGATTEPHYAADYPPPPGAREPVARNDTSVQLPRGSPSPVTPPRPKKGGKS